MSSAPESIKVSTAEGVTAKKRALRAIGVAAFLGGTVNILWVCIKDGWNTPLSIAAELLGRPALHGGAGIWVLGMAIHYFIACIWATVYYLVSRKLPFLTDHPLISGVNFGVWVQLFMLLVVLPLAPLHFTNPITLQGLATKIMEFGLPVAYSIRYFAPARTARQ
jgi:hypothetical protein